MAEFEIRAGRVEEARALVELYAAVAEERDGIASEPPIDLDARTTQFAAAMLRAAHSCCRAGSGMNGLPIGS